MSPNVPNLGRRGRRTEDTFYSNYRDNSKPLDVTRKANRQFESQAQTQRGSSSSSGHASESSSTPSTTSQPVYPDPFTVADAGFVDLSLCPIADFGSVDLHYHFRRGADVGTGHISVWLTDAATADYLQYQQSGPILDITLAASVSGSLLMLRITANHNATSDDVDMAVNYTLTRRFTF